MENNWIGVTPTTPQIANFNTTGGLGTPVIVAQDTFVPYIANGAAVQPLGADGTLIKFKKGTLSGVTTYARSVNQLKTLGAADADGLQLIHFVDPAYDSALMAGTVSGIDFKPFFDNAIIELNAIQASRGIKQKLLIPAFSYNLNTDASGTLDFNTTDLVIDANGATLISPTTAFTPPIQFNCDGDSAVLGLKIHFTGLGPNYLEILKPVRFFNVNYQRDATSSIPMYVRNSASGFEWHGGTLNAYGGMNVITASHGLLDGVFFTQPDSFTGSDDAIALKANDTTGSVLTDWRISNCRFRNKASCVSIGSEVGTGGALDPNYTVGVYGVVMENLVAEQCSRLFYGKPGAIYDYRDGTVQGVRGNNLVLRDPNALFMVSPIVIQVGHGARFRDARFTNVSVEGRFHSTGVTLAGLANFYLDDFSSSGQNGTAPPDITDVYVQGSFNDIWGGIAAGGAAPGSPAPNFVFFDKRTTNYGTASKIRLNVTANGCQNSGITISGGAGAYDNAIHIEKLHATNVDANGSSGSGGIDTASHITVGLDIQTTMAAGSGGKPYIIRAGGDIQTLPQFLANPSNNAITVQNNSTALTTFSVKGDGTLVCTNIPTSPGGSTQFLCANGTWAVPSGTGTGTVTSVSVTTANGVSGTVATPTTTPAITLSLGDITPTSWVISAANKFSSLTNTSTNPSNSALLTFTRVNNISSPSQSGASILVRDHTANYAIAVQDPNNANANKFSVKGDGTVLATGVSSTSGGVGYTTGAGGTVTQLTSKTTGVTLSKVCGQFTTSNSALAAGALATFQVTNTNIAATDTIVLCLQSGQATMGTYRYWVEKVAAGSFTVTIENRSAGSLSEALVFNFAAYKAVNA